MIAQQVCDMCVYLCVYMFVRQVLCMLCIMESVANSPYIILSLVLQTRSPHIPHLSPLSPPTPQPPMTGEEAMHSDLHF